MGSLPAPIDRHNTYFECKNNIRMNNIMQLIFHPSLLSLLLLIIVVVSASTHK